MGASIPVDLDVLSRCFWRVYDLSHEGTAIGAKQLKGERRLVHLWDGNDIPTRGTMRKQEGGNGQSLRGAAETCLSHGESLHEACRKTIQSCGVFVLKDYLLQFIAARLLAGR